MDVVGGSSVLHGLIEFRLGSIRLWHESKIGMGPKLGVVGVGIKVSVGLKSGAGTIFEVG